jgi:hypothetical protein
METVVHARSARTLQSAAEERHELLRRYLRSLTTPADGSDSAVVVSILRSVRADLGAHVSVLDLPSTKAPEDQNGAGDCCAGTIRATGQAGSRRYRWLRGSRVPA